MRPLLPRIVLAGTLGLAGCGGGGPYAGQVPPPPPPPVRTPVTPSPATFFDGPVTDVPAPVFGTAPYTLLEAPLADHDEDGKADLAWIVATASTTTTHEQGSRPGTGGGAFTGDYGGSGFKTTVAPFAAVGDVLGVGEEGFVFGVQSSATSVGITTSGYRISGGNRAGVGGYRAFSGTLGGLAIEDLDGDDIADVAALDVGGRRVAALLSNGETGLDAAVFSALPAGTGAAPTALTAGLFRTDVGALSDGVVALGVDGYVVLENASAGAFDAGDVVPLDGGGAFEALATGDLDGDGLLDVVGVVVAPGAPRRIGTLFGRGDGSFEELVPADVPAAIGAAPWRGFCAYDVNGDGRTDVAFAVPSLDRAVVLLSDAAGGFVAVDDDDLLGASATFAVADLDGDGDLDLLLGDAAALKVRTLINERN